MFLLSGLLGALLGSFVTASFNFWKFYRDELDSRIDELCATLLSASECASDYWSRKFEHQVDQSVAEAKIRSWQSMVDGFYAELRPHVREEDLDKLDGLFSKLLDALTGGEFSEFNRPADPTRLMIGPLLCSEIVVAVRRSHRRTLPFRSWVLGYRAFARWRKRIR